MSVLIRDRMFPVDPSELLEPITSDNEEFSTLR